MLKESAIREKAAELLKRRVDLGEDVQVQQNAPVAIQQVELEAEISALAFVLADRQMVIELRMACGRHGRR